MRPRISVLACGGLILLAANTLAQENPYFPVASGSSWNYQGPVGETVSTTVVGAEMYHGESVIRADRRMDRGNGAELVSYKYFLDVAGNVYLAGSALPESRQDMNRIFRPFMLELPAPDEMQPSWQDAFADSTYFGETFVYDLQHSVVHVYQADEEVTVPADQLSDVEDLFPVEWRINHSCVVLVRDRCRTVRGFSWPYIQVDRLPGRESLYRCD